MTTETETDAAEFLVLASAVARWQLNGDGVRRFVEALKTGLIEPSGRTMQAVAVIPAAATADEVCNYLQHCAALVIGAALVEEREDSTNG